MTSSSLKNNNNKYLLRIVTLSADDSMAILMAFQYPEIEVVGLTTIFGNASTKDATRNALLLVLVPNFLK